MTSKTYNVEKLVHHGMGIVHDESSTIFLPFVIPGEKVKIKIVPGTKNPIRAIATEIVEPSPDRVEPRCHLFRDCGGCGLQHIAYPAQLKLKQQILAESLERLAGLNPTIQHVIGSAAEYNYRSRIKLQVKKSRMGFFAHGSNKLVEVGYCHLAKDELNKALLSLENIISQDRPSTIELILMPDKTLAAVAQKGKKKKLYQKEQSGQEWKTATGLRVAFEQVNPIQNQALKETAGKLAAEIRPRGVIELYAGSGNLTEVLLPHCSWIEASDSDKAAVELGNRECADNCTFLHHTAASHLADAIERGLGPDMIVLDPPRTGAKEAMPGIASLNPRDIVYVSCDPPTLARDLKYLTNEGYEVKQVTPIDMFPQTAHIEVVVWLGKTGK